MYQKSNRAIAMKTRPIWTGMRARNIQAKARSARRRSGSDPAPFFDRSRMSQIINNRVRGQMSKFQ